MKHLTHFCIRHGLLPCHPRLRRMMLRSIFHPVSPRDPELIGWYDLGREAYPEDVARFKAWAEPVDASQFVPRADR